MFYQNSRLQYSHGVIFHKIQHLNVSDAIMFQCTFWHRLLEKSPKCQYNLIVNDIAWSKRLDWRMLNATICQGRIISDRNFCIINSFLISKCMNLQNGIVLCYKCDRVLLQWIATNANGWLPRHTITVSIVKAMRHCVILFESVFEVKPGQFRKAFHV